MAHWLAPNILEIGPAFTEVLSGRRQFFAKYHSYLHGRLEVVSYRIQRPKTVRLNAGLALVHFHYRMRTRTGRKHEDSHGKESMLVQKTRGRWRVRYIHWHRDP